jgi:digeranylgeranylglycerophospholipid reductase
MKTSFDLIVVGAGTAGCILAKKTAEAGFRVALLDVKKRKEIGYDWDIAVEKHILGRICLKTPEKTLLSEIPTQYRFYTEDPNHYIRMNATGESVFYVKHRHLNQFLLRMALESGVQFLDNHDAKQIITDNGVVCGVCGIRKGLFRPSYFSLTAKITADASGFNRILTRQVPQEFMIQSVIDNQDLVSAWQEEREIKEKDREELIEILGIQPGIFYTGLGYDTGYHMMFLRNNNTFLIIFATPVQGNSSHARQNCEEFLQDYPVIGKRISGGGKIIPIRHSIDTMVGDGFLCIGDAACQNVPITGSGVSSSLYAADVAASTITETLNNDDVSTGSLWSYNYNYQSKRGAIMASYEIIRLFLQHLGSKRLDRIIRSGLFYDDNFLQLYSSNQINYNINHIADVLRKIFANPGLLSVGMNIAQTVVDSNRMIQLYQKYPRHCHKADFFDWRYNVNRYFKKYHYYKEFAVDYVS